MSYLDILESELQEFEVHLPLVEKRLLAQYCEELSRWNKKVNLTSLTGRGLVRRLVVEPAWIASQLHLDGSLLDIGSGNGSPAIPLALVSAVRVCYMVESRTKRAAFLRHVVGHLALNNMIVHHTRLEDLELPKEKPNWVTLQAVRLDDRLFSTIRKMASDTTKIVWITSQRSHLGLKPYRSLHVPNTNTEVFLFRLDLS